MIEEENNNKKALPLNGMSREKELLEYLPFGKTTLWKWSKDGRFPKAIKISSTMTAWNNADVHAWFASVQAQQNTVLE